jgi:hypothetical protein
MGSGCTTTPCYKVSAPLCRNSGAFCAEIASIRRMQDNRSHFERSRASVNHGRDAAIFSTIAGFRMYYGAYMSLRLWGCKARPAFAGVEGDICERIGRPALPRTRQKPINAMSHAQDRVRLDRVGI